MAEQIKTNRPYPIQVKLRDGRSAVIRVMEPGDLDKIVSAIGSRKVSKKLATTDFDFHASALLSALGAKGTLQLAGILLSAEARQVLSSLA